jgi:hypothetical protein
MPAQFLAAAIAAYRPSNVRLIASQKKPVVRSVWLEVLASLGVLGIAEKEKRSAIRWADKIELKNGFRFRPKFFLINNSRIRNLYK